MLIAGASGTPRELRGGSDTLTPSQPTTAPLLSDLNVRLSHNDFIWASGSTASQTETVWKLPKCCSSNTVVETDVLGEKGMFPKSQRWLGQNSSPCFLTPSPTLPTLPDPQSGSHSPHHSLHHWAIEPFSPSASLTKGTHRDQQDELGERAESKQLKRITEKCCYFPARLTQTIALFP